MIARGLVGALALSVSLLASPALADPTTPAPAPEQGTPLNLRPSSPMSPASGSGGGFGWKLTAVAAIIGGAAWWLKRKTGAKLAPARAIKVVSRAAIGVRTELVVVEVEGQTLLLGVTPSSIQRLSILGAADPEEANATAPEEEATSPAEADASSTLGDRFGALLEGSLRRNTGIGLKKTLPAATTATTTTATRASAEPVEAQARGLISLVRR